MNIFGPSSIVKFASKSQKTNWLPSIINGQTKMCFAITEPDTGLDTTRLKTKAVKNKDHYIINGRKIWTSTAQITNKIMIIARTSERNKKMPTEGLSLFYTDFNRENIEVFIRSTGKNFFDLTFDREEQEQVICMEDQHNPILFDNPIFGIRRRYSRIK